MYSRIDFGKLESIPMNSAPYDTLVLMLIAEGLLSGH